MNKEDKTFPQTELQEKIYKFWKVRGWEEVKAILGNMNVSFHRNNPKYECLGLDYDYLEQFWEEARVEERARWKKKIEDKINEQIKTMDSFYDNGFYIGDIDFIKELPKTGDMIEVRIHALNILRKELLGDAE
jgi:hypothetical protein